MGGCGGAKNTLLLLPLFSTQPCLPLEMPSWEAGSCGVRDSSWARLFEASTRTQRHMTLSWALPPPAGVEGMKEGPVERARLPGAPDRMGAWCCEVLPGLIEAGEDQAHAQGCGAAKHRAVSPSALAMPGAALGLGANRERAGPGATSRWELPAESSRVWPRHLPNGSCPRRLQGGGRALSRLRAHGSP